MSKDLTPIPDGYDKLFRDLKDRIQKAQVRAAVAVNRELVLLYWQIGRSILDKQNREGWGAKVIDKLSSDLRKEFPEMRGLSTRNLKYMRRLDDEWSDENQFVQAPLAQITWYHNLTLIEKVKTPEERLWYAQKTIENGWSRAVLVYQIESGLYRRQGKAVTNFEQTLPSPQSDLAQQLIKDPYNFDFLSLGSEAQERHIHQGLLRHLREFLTELGVGFAFVGSQYHLEVGGDDFYIDLLFYHLKLRSYVVVELKNTDFKPEYAGKMNFYLSAVDDLLRHPDDQPTIGMIICKGKNKIVAEYALRDLSKPIGISEHQLTEALPEILKGQLPSVEDLESELADLDDEAK